MCNPNNSHTSSNFYLPTLYELLEHTTNLDSHKSNQSLLSFHEYLMSRHCSENLQFIIDINKYLFTHNSTNSSCNSGLVNLWNFIYEKYLTFDADLEINLPCRLKSQLKLNQLPELNVLKNCQKYIYDNLLISLYREFTKLMKQQYDKEMKKKKQQQQQEQEQEEKQLKQQKSISEQSSPINKNNNNGSSSSSSNSTGSFTHFKHSLSLNLPRRNSNKICNNKNNQHIKHIDDDDEDICPISKVNTSISTEKEEEKKEETGNVHHRKQHFIGYDYYTIPTIESTSSSSSSSSSSSPTTSSPTYFDNQNHNNSTHHHHTHNHNEEKDCFVINDNNYFTTWSMNRNNSSSSGTTSGTTTRTNSTSTRHNSSSGNSSGSSNNTSRGSSIGSIFMDNSIQYFNNKMKKFKFGSN